MGEPVLPDYDYYAADLTQSTVLYAASEKLIYEGKIERAAPGDRVADLTFEIKGQENFVALHESVLFVKLKVTKGDGSTAINDAATTSQDKVSIVNNALHSLFSKVEVKINNHVAECVENYPYRAYIEQLTSFDRETLEVRESGTVGWAKDTVGKHDEVTLVDNVGAKERAKYIKNSRDVWFCGRPHTSLFTQGCSIPPNNNITVKFTGSKDCFVLLSASSSSSPATYKVIVLDAYLSVMRQYVQPSLLQAHRLLREKGVGIPIQMRNVVVTSAALPTGNREITDFRSLFSSSPASMLPDRFFLFFVENDNAEGSYAKNPFNLKHCGITKLDVQVSKLNHQKLEYEPDFSSANTSLPMYYDFLREFAAHNGNRSVNLSLEEFAGGYTVFPFRIVPRCDHGNYLGPVEHGTLTIKMTLKDAPTTSLKVFALSEYRTKYEIQQAGEISMQ